MKRLFTTYYLIKLLISIALGFTSAIYMTFMIERELNLFEANLANACFFLGVFLFEIPTGVFADRFKKKYSTMVGCLISAIGLYVLGASWELPQFILGEVIIALGLAFMSGAGDAWFVNESKLLGYDYENNRTRIMRNARLLQVSAGVFAGFIGSVIADYNPQLTWTSSSAIFLLVFCVTCTMKEDWVREGREKVTSKMLFLESCTLVRGRPQLMFAIQISAFYYFGMMSMNMLWQPFLNSGMEGYMILGYAWIAMQSFNFIGASCALRVHRLFQSEEKTLIYMLGLIGLSILIIVANPYVIASVLLVVYQMFRGVFDVIHPSYVQGHVSDGHRATMGSTVSAMNTLAGFLGLLTSGLLSEYVSIEVAWIVSAGVFLGVTWFLSRKTSKT